MNCIHLILNRKICTHNLAFSCNRNFYDGLSKDLAAPLTRLHTESKPASIIVTIGATFFEPITLGSFQKLLAIDGYSWSILTANFSSNYSFY